jgi:hypothetical protein
MLRDILGRRDPLVLSGGGLSNNRHSGRGRWNRKPAWDTFQVNLRGSVKDPPCLRYDIWHGSARHIGGHREVHDVSSVSALIEPPWGHVPSPPWDQQARHACDIRRGRLERPRHLLESEKKQSPSVVGGRGQIACVLEIENIVQWRNQL